MVIKQHFISLLAVNLLLLHAPLQVSRGQLAQPDSPPCYDASKGAHASPSTPPRKTKGILWIPIRMERKNFGEPGQTVTYWVSNPKTKNISVILNGKLYENIAGYHVIPYDPELVVPLAYINLTPGSGRIAKAFETEEVERRYLFAKNVSRTFANDPLAEEILALGCEYAERYENLQLNRGGDRGGRSRGCFEEYLKKYPEGIYRDRFEWKLVQLRNSGYEFEGYAKYPVGQIKAFEEFLREHPQNKAGEEIELRIALLYRIAYECVEYADTEEKRGGFTKQDGRRFLERSKEIYTQLLTASDLTVRETARVALYSIKQGRRCYYGYDDWMS